MSKISQLRSKLATQNVQKYHLTGIFKLSSCVHVYSVHESDCIILVSDYNYKTRAATTTLMLEFIIDSNADTTVNLNT